MSHGPFSIRSAGARAMGNSPSAPPLFRPACAFKPGQGSGIEKPGALQAPASKLSSLSPQSLSQSRGSPASAKQVHAGAPVRKSAHKARARARHSHKNPLPGQEEGSSKAGMRRTNPPHQMLSARRRPQAHHQMCAGRGAASSPAPPYCRGHAGSPAFCRAPREYAPTRTLPTCTDPRAGR